MNIINKSLKDPVARVSNETIGGLCHLVIIEVGMAVVPIHFAIFPRFAA